MVAYITKTLYLIHTNTHSCLPPLNAWKSVTLSDQEMKQTINTVYNLMLKYNQGIDKHVHKVRKTYAWMCFIHVFVCGCVLYMSLGVDVFYTSLCAWMCFIHVFVCSRMAFCACGPSSGKQTKKAFI